MNPFSGFLQPQNNRPLEGLATTQDLLRVVQGNKELGQRQLENTQQNTRANEYLKLQQGDQAHRFGAEEQKQVEALLAEYQDAEDQGDPVRLSRASQQLQRFGMDVGQKQAPDLRALTGERSLPNVQKNPATAGTAPSTPANLADFRQGQSIDSVVSEEMKSRDALRVRNDAPEPELSQQDFEEQLINGTQSPGRYEEAGQTTDEFRKMLPQSADEPEDLGDVDDPAFKAAAAQEGGVIDLDAEDPQPLQIGAANQPAPQAPAQAPQQPRRLATQLLPTVISKGGKKLYETTGPSGRYASMVSGVFEPYVAHENPQIAAAAKSAQGFADKLIRVDNVPPAKAIEMARDQMFKDAGLTVGLERTKLGSRPKYGGAGGGAVGDMPLTGKELALLGDDAQQLMLSITAKPEYQKVSVMDDVLNGAESALSSNDPVRQQQAISDIMRARSGLTVRKDEEMGLQNAAGLWDGLRARLSQKAGYGLTDDYRKALAGALTAQRAINDRIRRRIAEETKQFYLKTRTTSDSDTGSRAQQVRRNGEAVEGMLGRNAGADADPNADLYR